VRNVAGVRVGETRAVFAMVQQVVGIAAT
jgi:hypothetical protein